MKGLRFDSNMYGIFNNIKREAWRIILTCVNTKWVWRGTHLNKPKSSIPFYFVLTIFSWNRTIPTLWKHRQTDLYGQINHPIKACCFLWIVMYVFPSIIWRTAMWSSISFFFFKSHFSHCTRLGILGRPASAFLSTKKGQKSVYGFVLWVFTPIQGLPACRIIKGIIYTDHPQH